MSLAALDAAGGGMESTRGRTRSRGEGIGLLVILVLAGWFYFYRAVADPSQSATTEIQGYYGWQADAFLHGEVALGLKPNPELLRLADPYDPVANAPYRVHDMTLYQGRYYLYFGAGPVITLLLPWRLLTGTFLNEGLTTALFAFAALGAALGFLRRIRFRHFPQAHPLTVGTAAVVLAFGNLVPLLMPGAAFYQVPMTAAYFFGVLALWALSRALAKADNSGAGWMMAAGLAWGLAVAARPSYLFGAALLGAPMVGFWARKESGSFPRAVRQLAAAALPLALVGVALMAYNYARFGSVAEFGMKYQLASFRIGEQRLMDWRFLPTNLREYLFAWPAWGPWFPFLHLPENQGALGALRVFPFFWFALVLPFSWCWRRRITRPGEFAALAVAASLALAGILGFLGIYFAVILRYAADFVVWLAILSALGLLAGEAGLRSPWPRRSLRVLAAGLGLGAAVVNLLACVGDYPATANHPWLARAANWPSAAYARLTGVEYGPLRLRVRFPANREGRTEPLVSAGLWPSSTDIVRVTYLPKSQVQFSFFHAGQGGPSGDPVTIDFAQEHEVEIFLGSFAPPSAHPAFSDWAPAAVVDLKHRLEVKLDGRLVLASAISPYDSRPGDLRIGADARNGGGGESFSGRIVAQERLPLEQRPSAASVLEAGKGIKLRLRFPSGRGGSSEPLLVTGSGKESDLVYVRYLAAGKLVIGLDHFGAGGPQTEVLDLDLLQSHELKLWVGPCAAGAAAAGGTGTPLARRYGVMLDGRLLIDAEQAFYPAEIRQAQVGLNLNGASSALYMFSGRIESVAACPPGEIFARDAREGWGAVNMVAVFPRGMSGYAEPLAVSGVSGAGDFIYVRYDADRRVRFGYDHWGVGGLEGKPVEIDYDTPHRLEFVMGALLPPGTPGDRTLVRVVMDGATVLEGHMASHPTTAAQVRIGLNPIGGSTCRDAFTGRILALERPANLSAAASKP